MSLRVGERVDDWDQQSFGGGYDALRELADGDFSGVVRAGGAEVYLTVGTVVDVRRGTIEDVDGTAGTAYRAPHPALPLLAVMQEADADVRAQYYTEETPISEVDGTLADGGFTGFLELSENVLSGDYFVVYHGGESMSVAYVGESERLLADDEAFETADEEVGIYKVRQVDIEPIEIPEPAAESTASGGDTAATAAGAETGDPAADREAATEAAGESAAVSDSTTDAGRVESAPSDAQADAPDEAAGGASASGNGQGAETRAAETRSGADQASDARPDAGAEAGSPSAAPADRTDESSNSDTDAEGATDRPDPEGGKRAEETASADESTATPPEDADTNGSRRTETTDGRSGRSEAETPTREHGQTEPEPRTESPDQGATRDQARSRSQAGSERRQPPDRETASDRRPVASGATTDADYERGDAPDAGSSRGDLRSSDSQAGDLETRAVPSLDPGMTRVPSREKRSSRDTGAREPAAGGPVPSANTDQRAQGASDEATHDAHGGTTPQDTTPERAEPTTDEPPASQEGELADLEAEIERLEDELAGATEERDELEAELAAVREERDELQAEVDRLDEELRRLEEQFGAASDAERRMTPPEAIEGTNLFVDYDSKGEATLEKAHGGVGSHEEVAGNLQLGIHTEFDQDEVAVGGQAFGGFLRETLHYRFARWVVGDLLFEIRETDQTDALQDLYDAIPEIRRVEFNGTVDVEYVEDSREQTGTERFDVIFRHRMGEPLVVANLNDARDPATGGMMDSLVTAAERVGQTTDELAAAFLVTSSFFESEALETVSEATRGGILSRDSRASFVNLSRKAGYHLCLTAAREGNFHMEVPEL